MTLKEVALRNRTLPTTGIDDIQMAEIPGRAGKLAVQGRLSGIR
jgi:hypothetical protein